ncbi:hypothetical protein D9M72_525940 [compost metagenome]
MADHSQVAPVVFREPPACSAVYQEALREGLETGQRHIVLDGHAANQSCLDAVFGEKGDAAPHRLRRSPGLLDLLPIHLILT